MAPWCYAPLLPVPPLPEVLVPWKAKVETAYYFFSMDSEAIGTLDLPCGEFPFCFWNPVTPAKPVSSHIITYKLDINSFLYLKKKKSLSFDDYCYHYHLNHPTPPPSAMAPTRATFPRPLRLLAQALLIVGFVFIACQTALNLHTQLNVPPPRRLRPGLLYKLDQAQQSGAHSAPTFPAAAFAEDGIQVVLKIGAAETDRLMASHVNGSTSCIPNLLVVSDISQTLGPFYAHDVLADVIHILSEGDRQIYQHQRESYYYWNTGLQPNQAARNLDRYKFLAMVEYAYAQNPSTKWYVFTETDTTVLWENMAQLLERFNWADPVYIGSPSPGRRWESHFGSRSTFFVYGGSGIVLSVTAIEKLLQGNRGGSGAGDLTSQLLINKYQDLVRDDCCGDSVLGYVSFQEGVKIQGQWPMFNPHPLHKTPLSKAYWCQPAISFHKSDPIAARELWDWEQKWRQERGPDQQQRPILYRDVVDFFDFASTPVRSDWNNVELDAFDAPTEEAHESFDSCKEACQNHPECFQFTHYRKQCRMSIIINFGIHAPPSKSDMTEGAHSVAGWDVDKIQKFKIDHDCNEVEWPEPSIERVY